MCGICGITDFSGRPVQEAVIHKMCQAMIHRGPDDEGIYISNAKLHVEQTSCMSIGLGHRRLSIIDLSPAGHQPMCNEDGTIWLVINGEIYNYLELKKILSGNGHRFKSNSDAEVVIHLYEEYGEKCVQQLTGMFAFAIWDVKKKKLVLARDRPGKKPLLYYHKNNLFCFASEFESLLSSGLIDKEINFESIHFYLTFGYIPSPLTIYKNIFKLPPAHHLALVDNQIDIKQYWMLDYTKKVIISEEDAAAEVLRLLKESVKTRLCSDVPLGAFLSGGIDSSAVVGLMALLSADKVKTFSIGFDDGDFNELEHAKRVAERFDTDHHEFIVRPKALDILPLLVERYGEPYADSSAVPTFYVSQQTKQFVTVALNGDGGDEAFAGYDRYQAIIVSEIYNKIPGLIRKRIVNKFIDIFPDSVNPKNRLRRIKRFINGTSEPLIYRYLRWVGIFNDFAKHELYTNDFFESVSNAHPAQFVASFLKESNGVHLLDRLLMADTNTYLPGDLLVKVDIASMANSLEARSPFLDHKLMEFAASLPHNYKMKRFNKKYILKKAVAGLIPKENIIRAKMGFGVPIGKWFRTDLKDFLKGNLLSSVSLNRGYFKPEAVKNLVEFHVNGIRDHSHQLWALLMLELWHQRFVD